MGDRNKIIFTIKESGTNRQIETYENEYRNLMVLLKDRIYPEDFGECGGQGRCATCIVRVEGGDQLLAAGHNRNEQSTLAKNSADQRDMRLSCQILINELLNDSILHIAGDI